MLISHDNVAREVFAGDLVMLGLDMLADFRTQIIIWKAQTMA